MKRSLFKVRDKGTGKFWNGHSARNTFTDQGKSWSSRAGCENALSYFVNYQTRWNNLFNTKTAGANWEIVEIELIPQEKKADSVSVLMETLILKEAAGNIDSSFSYFVDKMHRMNKLDQIEFLFKLKVAEGNYRVTMDEIKEARSQLRQLGVKTRTFKESSGVFGMMDRQQALKAKMVLDIETSLDLRALRTQLGI